MILSFKELQFPRSISRFILYELTQAAALLAPNDDASLNPLDPIGK